MKRLFLYLIFTGLSVNSLFSQNESERMASVKRDILDSVMNIRYTHPRGEGYRLDSAYFVNRDTFYANVFFDRILSAIIGFDETHITSLDGHFLTFISIREPFTLEDADEQSHNQTQEVRNTLLDRVDKEHIDEVKDIIEEVYGENNVAQWKKYVRYYSSQDAKEQFNADTVITFSLPKKKDGYYIRSYPYCSVLILKKAGRGCLPMFCFYDEVGKKNLEKYMSDMNGAFRYGDEPPLINKLVRTRDIVTIRSLPGQKKQDPIR